MKPEEKALALSYILCQLLNKNLEVVLHELNVSDAPDAGKMQHRIEKLRGASNKTFALLERNVGEDIEDLRSDIEKVLEELWG